MKKYIACILGILMLSSLTACSYSNETLNELLFVNKIIDLIEIEETEKTDGVSSNIPTPPSENNPFIADEVENKTTVSGNDTFIYLDWSPAYGHEIDLDLMVLLVGSNGRAEQTNLINYNNFSGSEEVAVHMGDRQVDSECIYLNLDKIPSNISKILVYCYNYSNNWDDLSKLKVKVDSLNEKYESDIRAGKINPIDIGVEFGSESTGVTYGYSVSNAVQICSYERRGPIWYLNKEMTEIFNLNNQLAKYGIYTKDYSSAYLDEQARLEAERLEQERLEAERIAAEQAAQQAQQSTPVVESTNNTQSNNTTSSNESSVNINQERAEGVIENSENTENNSTNNSGNSTNSSQNN